MKIIILILVSVSFACGPRQESVADMHADLGVGLWVSEPPEYVVRLVSTEPTHVAVESAVKRLSWRDITFVVLKQDSTNWIELSGSKIDGLSMQYRDGTAVYMTTTPPNSLEDGTGILKSYVDKTDLWKANMRWK